ncbi:MAG: radical SAM family heme chaperone HemW [Bacteroidetes bacterium]|nr:radical SAM family heme chaperone HemW [Bacteroidota bacterium]
MAGIYLHIPFCKSKCHYCNFYSMASVKYKDEFINTLLDEIKRQRNYLGDQIINTIYLGGGTPSLLSVDELNAIFSCLNNNFHISKNPEITLEANPDDISEKWVKEMKNTPVNRISLGVQSFFDDDLKYLNRIHSGEDALTAIKRLQDHGFTELTIDLIYGMPTLTNEKWEQNLNSFIDFKLPHLSAYALTVEDKTVLYALIQKKKLKAPPEDAMIEQFKILIKLTEEWDYTHYEISNFAQKGHYSKHNSLYWTGGHYLGLGPSAHSFNGKSRRWNKAGMKAWLGLKEYYNESFEEEILSPDQRYNEYVMTSLRTVWGCDYDIVKEEFGNKYAKHLLKEVKAFIQEQKIEQRGNKFFLTNKGKLFADGIASELFM